MICGVLLDLGGVVFTGASPLAGSVDAIARLRAGGLPVRFVTNITRQPRAGVIAQLQGMGIAPAPGEVFTPAIAARAFLDRHQLKAHLLVHPALLEDFGPQGEDAVVIGDAGEGFTYEAMNRAFRLLSRGAPLLALARNRSFRDEDGALSLDAGAFVAALEYAAGQKAAVFGKPSADFFAAALASMGVAPPQAVMVGDDAEADAAGAIAAGLQGILVRSGKYRPGDEARHPPTHLADDLAAAADWILARKGA